MKLITTLFLFLILLNANSQFSVKGVVIDSKTFKKLPFVTIQVNNSKIGTTTDIDGLFSIKTNVKINFLKLSYVGYERKTIKLDGKENLTIKLSEKTLKLKELIIRPEENPALRIIRNVIKNQKKNNVEYLNYSCKLYNKFSMGINLKPSDTLQENFSDNMSEEFFDVMSTMNFFLLETVVNKKHISPDRNKEKVIASKMSGFDNPSFLALATKLQSFTFYKNYFDIMGEKFLSPISKTGLRNYFYLIEDTIFQKEDTVFVISYRPYKGKRFQGMKGVLQINTNQFAITNVIAEPADTNSDMEIKIQQFYFQDSNNKWIPKQLLGEIVMKNFNMEGYPVVYKIKTYLTEFDYSREIKRSEVDNIEVEIMPNAHKISKEAWDTLRTVNLELKERTTLLDSFKDSIPFSLDKILDVVRILKTGKIPFGKISMDLDKVMNYNDFEGFRLGLGLHTNDRLWTWMNFGGYFGYGFKDKNWKYGGDINFMLSRKNEVNIKFSYINDVVSPGETEFFDKKESFLSNNNLYQFYVNRKDKIEKLEAVFSFRSLRYLKTHLFINSQIRSVTDDYIFNKKTSNSSINIGEKNHFITEYGVNLRYAFKETFYYDGLELMSLGTKYPVLFGKIALGFNSDYGNTVYSKFDFSVSKSIFLGEIGTSYFSISAGKVIGDVPYSLQFNSPGMYNDLFGLSSNNVFETMRINEFLSDKYAALYFGHKFKPIYFSKKFQPQIEIVHNMTTGRLEDKLSHKNISIKTLENGYLESGIRIYDLIKINTSTFGLGTFYRYGANSLETFKENIALKMVLGYTF